MCFSFLEEKVFGPYNKVYIHQNSLCSNKLLEKFQGPSSANVEVPLVTDWNASLLDTVEVTDVLKNTQTKLNIFEASETDVR